MEIKGKIVQILEPVSGISKAGRDWSKQEFVIEIPDEQFPKQVCFTLFGDKTSLLNGIQSGTEVNVSFSIESREFSGKWYHNINAWKVELLSSDNKPQEYFPPEYKLEDIPPAPAEDENDLPF